MGGGNDGSAYKGSGSGSQQGNHYCARDYGPSTPNQNGSCSYHNPNNPKPNPKPNPNLNPQGSGLFRIAPPPAPPLTLEEVIFLRQCRKRSREDKSESHWALRAMSFHDYVLL